jgi:hypothetical protein
MVVMIWTRLVSARLRRASMVAVVRATMHAREASPMAQPMSVLSIDLAQWVLYVVGIDDTGAVVFRCCGAPEAPRARRPPTWKQTLIP